MKKYLFLILLFLAHYTIYAQENVALNKSVTVTSFVGENTASKLNDGDVGSRWESEHGVDNQEVHIDLGDLYQFISIKITWETASAANYEILVSDDDLNWNSIREKSSTAGARADEFKFTSNEVRNVRYVRIDLKSRTSDYGYSICELEIYGAENNTQPAATTLSIKPENAFLLSELPSELEILSLNNSLINYNNQPDIFNQLASAAGKTATWTMQTHLGQSLRYHYENAASKTMVMSKPWTHIVLQELSNKPLTDPTDFLESVRLWKEFIAQYCPNPNARIILFMNWPYTDSADFAADMAEIYANYETVASELGVSICPVGKTFDLVRLTDGTTAKDALYTDNRHPSQIASYMSACTIYAGIFGESPVGNSYLPATLTQADATRIQTHAWNAYQAHNDIVDDINGTISYSYEVLDQFDRVITNHGAISWNVDGGGSISNGLFTSNGTEGEFEVSASLGTLNATANIDVVKAIIPEEEEDNTYFASITASTSYSQDFDLIGNTAIATLPQGWKIEKRTDGPRTLGTFGLAVKETQYAAGVNIANNAPNGLYNFGTDADRAVGGISTSSGSVVNGTRGVNVYLRLKNTDETAINNFNIKYDIEKYRKGNNNAGFAMQMYYSTNGINWTNAGTDFYTLFAKDNETAGYASVPGETRNISANLTQAVAPDGFLYIGWNYSVASGTDCSYAQALALDNIIITVIDNITPLDAPVIASIDEDGIITFDPVQDAGSYIAYVYKDNTLVHSQTVVSGDVINYTASVTYNYTVKLKSISADYTQYLDSDFSDAYTWYLEAPYVDPDQSEYCAYVFDPQSGGNSVTTDEDVVYLVIKTNSEGNIEIAMYPYGDNPFGEMRGNNAGFPSKFSVEGNAGVTFTKSLNANKNITTLVPSEPIATGSIIKYSGYMEYKTQASGGRADLYPNITISYTYGSNCDKVVANISVSETKLEFTPHQLQNTFILNGTAINGNISVNVPQGMKAIPATISPDQDGNIVDQTVTILWQGLRTADKITISGGGLLEDHTIAISLDKFSEYCNMLISQDNDGKNNFAYLSIDMSEDKQEMTFTISPYAEGQIVNWNSNSIAADGILIDGAAPAVAPTRVREAQNRIIRLTFDQPLTDGQKVSFGGPMVWTIKEGDVTKNNCFINGKKVFTVGFECADTGVDPYICITEKLITFDPDNLVKAVQLKGSNLTGTVSLTATEGYLAYPPTIEPDVNGTIDQTVHVIWEDATTEGFFEITGGNTTGSVMIPLRINDFSPFCNFVLSQNDGGKASLAYMSIKMSDDNKTMTFVISPYTTEQTATWNSNSIPASKIKVNGELPLVTPAWSRENNNTEIVLTFDEALTDGQQVTFGAPLVWTIKEGETTINGNCFTDGSKVYTVGQRCAIKNIYYKTESSGKWDDGLWLYSDNGVIWEQTPSQPDLSAYNVIISKENELTLEGNAEVNNLTVDGTLTLSESADLTLNADLILNPEAILETALNSTISIDGNLVFNKTTESSAEFHRNGSVNIAPNGKVKVNMTFSGKERWHFIGFPFDIDNITDINGNQLVRNTQYLIGQYNTQTRAQGISGWGYPAVGEMPKAGVGYIVALLEDIEEATIVFEGEYSNAGCAVSATTNLTYDTYNKGMKCNFGWNFFAHPVTTCGTSDIAEGEFHYAYDYNADTYEVNIETIENVNSFDAYFVKTVEPSSISFSSISPSLRSVKTPAGSLNLYLGEDKIYKTRIRTLPHSTADYDELYDAPHTMAMLDNTPQIYTLINSLKIAINSVPENTTVALGVRVPESGEYTLSWNTDSGNDDTQLYDKVTNQKIKLGEQSTYKFTTTEKGEINNRFEIIPAEVTDRITYKENKLNVYVVNGQIVLDGINTTADISLYDITGRCFFKDVQHDTTQRINLHNSGIYIIELKYEDINEKIKIIVP